MATRKLPGIKRNLLFSGWPSAIDAYGSYNLILFVYTYTRARYTHEYR